MELCNYKQHLKILEGLGVTNVIWMQGVYIAEVHRHIALTVSPVLGLIMGTGKESTCLPIFL